MFIPRYMFNWILMSKKRLEAWGGISSWVDDLLTGVCVLGHPSCYHPLGTEPNLTRWSYTKCWQRLDVWENGFRWLQMIVKDRFHKQKVETQKQRFGHKNTDSDTKTNGSSMWTRGTPDSSVSPHVQCSQPKSASLSNLDISKSSPSLWTSPSTTADSIRQFQFSGRHLPFQRPSTSRFIADTHLNGSGHFVVVCIASLENFEAKVNSSVGRACAIPKAEGQRPKL